MTRSGTYRQSEDGVIESATDGTFTIRSWEREQPWSQIGATWLDADNQVGETARVAFVQGNPLMPIFFSRGSKPQNRIVPEVTGYELVWRTRASWQCALGAEKSVNIPGAALDNTEICTLDYQYIDFIVKRPDGVYVGVGTYSSNYVGNSYLMAWNFFTGEQLWESPALCYDAYPQVEYIPDLNAVFCSGFWIYYNGSEYSYTEAPRLFDLDTGALLLGSEFVGGETPDFPDPAVPIDAYKSGSEYYLTEERPRKWFIDRAAEMVRYQLPYSDELAAQSLFHERIVGLAGYKFSLAGGSAHQAPATLTYEGTSGSAGVLLENTDILYNWNWEYYEACDFNAKPVKAWVGFGYRRLGVGLEWNEPERYPSNPKNRSIFSTTTANWEGDYANPEYRYNPTATEYKQTEVDRIGFKIQATNSAGEVMEWSRTWDMDDHTQVIIDDDVKTLATLKSEWEASVVSAAQAYYLSALGSSNPGGYRDASLWDLDLAHATLDGDPTNFSVQADLTTGPPGAESSGGWAVGSDSGITCTCGTPSRALVHNGNFAPNYNLFAGGAFPTYATGNYGNAGTSNQYDVNLYSARVNSTRSNGERIVVNYSTPSWMDLYASGYYNARRWRGTTSGEDEDVGYVDQDSNSGFTFFINDPSELPELAADAPDSAPGLWNWIIDEDLNGYSSDVTNLGGTNYLIARSYQRILQLASTVNTNVFKNYFITATPDWVTTVVDVLQRVSPPATYDGFTVLNTEQYFDPITRSWSDTYFSYSPPGGFTYPHLDLCEDFDHRVARQYVGLPRGGKSAVTVLREIDGGLVEECTLEFGDDFEKFNAHGTSRYPYTNGTPGKNGLWIDRITWSDPADYLQGDHTTKVERYDWDGTLLWSHDAPSNPWAWYIICGNDVSTGEDFLLMQNTDTNDLHLYNEDGFVRTYSTMLNYLYNGGFWVVDGEIYYTLDGSETAVDGLPGQYTYAGNKIIKL